MPGRDVAPFARALRVFRSRRCCRSSRRLPAQSPQRLVERGTFSMILWQSQHSTLINSNMK